MNTPYLSYSGTFCSPQGMHYLNQSGFHSQTCVFETAHLEIDNTQSQE